ncbi:MAG: alpha/beta hydrolase [Fibrobacteria bacterium]
MRFPSAHSDWPALMLALALWLSGCNSMFYYPGNRDYFPPEKLNIKYDDRTFRTASGMGLHARLFYHDTGSAPRGLFVLFHGNAQNLTAHYLQFAWVLKRGYDLFVFDYPGYGLSEGRPTRKGTLESGNAALAYVSAELAPPADQSLIVVGESLGGAVMLRCVQDWRDRDKATLLVAESSFDSYQGVARSVLAKSWVTWAFQPLAYVLVTDAGSPGHGMASLHSPPLLVGLCLQDEVVDPVFSRRIYTAAAGPKWLWEAPDCGHIQVFKSQTQRERLLCLIDSLHASRKPDDAKKDL